MIQFRATVHFLLSLNLIINLYKIIKAQDNHLGPLNVFPIK